MEGFLTGLGKPPAQLESIAIRRASIQDADKVRYRVYSSPTEFVAVIAENALLAVKASGVENPHKIMRDLPTEGIAIEAAKMAQVQDNAPRITLPTTPKKMGELKLEDIPDAHMRNLEPFVPMGLADLQNKGKPRARILPPQMLTEIIEQYQQNHAPEVAPAPPPAPAPEPVAALPAEEIPVAPVPSFEEQVIAAPVAQTVEERIARLADEVLPPKNATEENPLAALEDPTLSADEVEKLLNGNP